MVKPTNVRLILTIVVSRGWQINQLDVQITFLNKIKQEEVCMEQPSSFINPTFSSHVYQLHKSLYDLKQSPQALYTILSDYLLSISFYTSKVDTSLFILFVGSDIFLFTCLCK